jgi:hypothetical protein
MPALQPEIRLVRVIRYNRVILVSLSKTTIYVIQTTACSADFDPDPY